MRSVTRAAAATLLTIGLACTGIGAAGASTPASARWRISYRAGILMSQFVDGVALSPGNVWAAGSVIPEGPPSGDRPLLRHWNGRSWTVVRLSRQYGHATLSTIADSGARNVWVFGQYRNASGTAQHVFALRWNGAWAQRGIWSTFNTIGGALVLSQNDVWIFGSIGTWHYDGSRWTIFRMPFVISRASAISGTDIWAAGRENTGTRAPVLAHWHGGRWTTQPLPRITSSFPGPGVTDVLAGSDHDVWLVGGTVTATGALRPLALHWSAGRWRQFHMAGSDYLDRVVPDGSGGLWASFAGPYDGYAVLHYSSGRWALVRLPAVTGKATSVFALAHAARSATSFAFGQFVWGGLPATDGLILRFSR